MTKQTTFWQFTVDTAKDAVRLYFRPVQQVATWLNEDAKPSTEAEIAALRQNQDNLAARLHALEEATHVPFDSAEDLHARLERLHAWLHTPAASNLTSELKSQIELLNQQFADMPAKLRQIETTLGFEKPLPPRSKGATGD